MGQAEDKVAIASAAGPILEFLHRANGQLLLSVAMKKEDGMLTAFHFQLERDVLSVRAKEDDDSIEIEMCPSLPEGYVPATQSCWQSMVGKEFGWSWLMINQQGYTDGLLVSVNEVVPQVALTVVASEIIISRVEREQG